jgi:hypothetical protein
MRKYSLKRTVVREQKGGAKPSNGTATPIEPELADDPSSTPKPVGVPASDVEKTPTTATSGLKEKTELSS